MIVPDIDAPWIVHMYAKVPAVLNVRVYIPVIMSPDVPDPLLNVTLCDEYEPWKFQVTVVPTATVSEDGMNSLSNTPTEFAVVPVIPPVPLVVPPGDVGAL